jgi:hypothetical protein
MESLFFFKEIEKAMNIAEMVVWRRMDILRSEDAARKGGFLF